MLSYKNSDSTVNLTNTLTSGSPSSAPDFSASKNFYITFAHPNDSNDPPLVVTYVEPSIQSINGIAIYAGSTLANVVTNTVAMGIGAKNKLVLNQPKLRLVKRTNALSQKWTLNEDGQIVNCWKKDYFLGGKPCRFHPLLDSAENSSEEPNDSPLGKPFTLRHLNASFNLSGSIGIIGRPSASVPNSSPTTKQLAVLRLCCGEQDCEKAKVREGIECGFVLDNEADEDAAALHAGGMVTQEDTKQNATDNGSTDKPKSKRSSLRGLFKSNKKNDSKSSTTPQTPSESGQATPISSLDADHSTHPSGSLLDLHQWRIQTDFTVFVNDRISPVIEDFASHLSYQRYLKETAATMKREAELSNTSMRVPIKVSVDWQWKQVWNDEGIGSKNPVSIWRPDCPAGFVYIGDFAHNSRSPPSTRNAYVAQMHSAFALPTSFSLTWSKVTRKKSLYVWNPIPPSPEYIALGQYCTFTSEGPDIQSSNIVVVHRSYLKNAKKSLTIAIWNDSSVDAAFWAMPAPMNTFICDVSHMAPTGTHYTLLEPYEPSEPSAFSIPIDVMEGVGSHDDYELLWDDRGSITGTDDDISFWRPKLKSGYVRFGDYGVRKYTPNARAITALDHPGFTRPLRYDLVYKIRRNNKKCYVWRPVSPASEYVVLGDIVTVTKDPPSVDLVRCVHQNLLLPYSKVEQAWLENSATIVSQIGNLNVINVARTAITGDTWGPAAVWQNLNLNTIVVTRGTHSKPSTMEYRLPMTAREHSALLESLEVKATFMMNECFKHLHTAFQSLKDSSFARLGMPVRQVSALLQAVQTTYEIVNPANKENEIQVTDSFKAFLSSKSSDSESLYRAFKRYVYETIASGKNDIDSVISLLNILYPLLSILPDLSPQEVVDWKIKPKFYGDRSHRKLLNLLFDDIYGEQIAEKFFNALPLSSMPLPEDDDDDRYLDTGTGGNTNTPSVQELIDNLKKLLDDVKVVHFGTDEVSIKELFVEFYHRYFMTIFQKYLQPKHLAMSELLTVVKFYTYYNNLIHVMLPFEEISLIESLDRSTTIKPLSRANSSPAYSVSQSKSSLGIEKSTSEVAATVVSDLDINIDACMDRYEDLSKEKIIGWVGNIIKNERKSQVDRDEDKYFITSGPQDIFLNVNNLYDHAVQLNLGAKPLFRVAVMYAHVLQYYQQCLKRVMMQWESALEASIASTTPGNILSPSTSTSKSTHSTTASSTTTSSNPAKSAAQIATAADTEILLNEEWIFAQINNIVQYEANTDELRQHMISTLTGLPEETLYGLEETLDDVHDGFFDVALYGVRTIHKKTCAELLPQFSKFFTDEHLTDSVFTDNFLNNLGHKYDTICDSIRRDSLLKSYLETALTTLTNLYTKAFLSQAKRFSSKTISVATARIEKDRQAIIKFFEDFSEWVAADTVTFQVQILVIIHDLLTIDAAFLSLSIKRLISLCKSPTFSSFTPYFMTTTILDLRHEVPPEDKKKLLEFFPPEQRISLKTGPGHRSKKSNLDLADLALSANTLTYCLEITVMSGHALAIKDLKSSDPFCVVQLLEAMEAPKPVAIRRTKYIHQSLNPVWNVRFADFSQKEIIASRYILFEVWDSDYLKNDFMGHAMITFEDIRKQQLIEKTATSNSIILDKNDHKPISLNLTLQQRAGVKNQGSNTVSGTITVQILYYNISSEPAATSEETKASYDEYMASLEAMPDSNELDNSGEGKAAASSIRKEKDILDTVLSQGKVTVSTKTTYMSKQKKEGTKWFNRTSKAQAAKDRRVKLAELKQAQKEEEWRRKGTLIESDEMARRQAEAQSAQCAIM